ncbi:MAG: oligosaccharide flippase family protein, partial [Candidatus Buchananbacteria bacterium]
MINSIYGRIRNFWRIKFIKDAFTLQIGSVFGTALSFLASIIYARILGPADYGVYVLIFSLVSLVGAAESWGEGYALLTLLSAAWGKRDKAEIKSLVLFFIKISLLEFVFIGLIAFILAPTVSLWLYQNSKIGQLARWILLANIIQFIFSLLTIILQSARKIKQLTLLENINKLVYLIIPVGLVLFGLGLNGIVIGNLLSSVIFLIFSIYLYSVLAKKTSLLPSIKEIFVGLRGVKITKYLKFSILIAVDKNLANFYSSLPMVFLGMFVVPENIAFFKIAFSYVGLSLISLKGVSRLLLVQLPKSRIYGMAELK